MNAILVYHASYTAGERERLKPRTEQNCRCVGVPIRGPRSVRSLGGRRVVGARNGLLRRRPLPPHAASSREKTDFATCGDRLRARHGHRRNDELHDVVLSNLGQTPGDGGGVCSAEIGADCQFRFRRLCRRTGASHRNLPLCAASLSPSSLRVHAVSMSPFMA